MVKYEGLRRIVPLLAVLTPCAVGWASQHLEYPPARRVDQVDVYHGVEVHDPYRWLEDPDSPETRAFVAAEDGLTADVLGSDPRFATYHDRFLELLPDRGPYRPQKRGDRIFYMEAPLGTGNRAAIRVLESGRHRTLLDSRRLWPDSTRQIQNYLADRDGRYLLLMISHGPGTPMVYRVFDVGSGRLLDAVIEHMVPGNSVAWAEHLGGFFYTPYPVPPGGTDDDIDYRNQEIRFHRLNTPVSADRVVYTLPDHPQWLFALRTTPDEATLVINAAEATRSVTHPALLDLTREGASVEPLAVPGESLWTYVDADADGYLFWTRFDAPRGRLLHLVPGRPDAWTEVVPEERATLGTVQRIGDRLLATYLVDARRDLRVLDRDGSFVGDVDLQGIGGVGSGGSPDDPLALVRTWHVGDPGSIRGVDMRDLSIRPVLEPDTDIDPSRYVIEQTFVTSADGTRVPMSLVHRADLRRDGTNPVFMYAYGAWNWAAFPYFQIHWYLWVESGGIFAVPNVRGGGEYGEAWHQAGIKLNKPDSFADMIAAAEWLVESGWSSPGRIVANGGSASGLLAATVAMQRPELFGGAIIDHPSLDLIRAQAQPGGFFLVPEYGSVDDPREFRALLAMSPYHNVAPDICYPPMLVTVGGADRTVVQMHGLKFIAAVQHANACDHPALLEWIPRGGHLVFGTTPEERADVLARQLVFARRSAEGTW